MSKTLGDKVFKDEKKWWWCKEHRLDFQFDRLYVTHPPENHSQWLINKQERERKRPENPSGSGDAHSSGSTSNSNKRILLTNNLKAALILDHQFSKFQVESLFSDLSQEN